MRYGILRNILIRPFGSFADRYGFNAAIRRLGVISGNNRHLFSKGSSDQQTVEGVAVYLRQSFKGGQVSGFYWEYGNAVGFRVMDKTGCPSLKVQLPRADFNGNFPRRSNAEVKRIGTIPNNMVCRFRQSVTPSEEPYGDMGIKRGTFALWARLRFQQVAGHYI